MTEQSTLQQARRRRLSRISPVWLVPIAVVLIALWLAYDTLSNRGPRLVLEMENAEGIEPGTLIRALNVEVGRVDAVELSDDLSHILVSARLNPGTEGLLAEDTLFWVVKPRIGLEGVSGLGTVLSGAYLELRPGSGLSGRRHFEVLDQPPITPASAEGLHITLLGDVASSLRVGDPVNFQGLRVGRVEEVAFDVDTRLMRHRLFIESPYDTLVTENTRFWTAGGMNLELDAQGIRVKVESLESLLIGGVTFGYLEGLPIGSPAGEDSQFTLFSDEESARQDSFSRYLEYVLLIDGTVRGLASGAAVEFRGVRVGTVAAAPWNFELPRPGEPTGAAIPVLIRIEPERLAGPGGANPATLDDWSTRFDGLIQSGLHARLKTGNLLTGALFVDLDFVERPADAAALTQTFNGMPVFPSAGGGFAELEAQLASLLEKLNDLPIEGVLGRLESNLAASEAMIEDLQVAAQSLQSLLEQPGLQDMPANFNRTLDELRRTVQGFAPGSSAYQELEGTLQGLESLLRDLQPAARTLSDRPSALIFDRRGGEDPVPRAREGN